MLVSFMSKITLPLLVAAASASAQFAATELDYVGRIGLHGGVFTSSAGQEKVGSNPTIISAQFFSGYALVGGTSTMYSGTTETGTATWVARTTDALTRRIGLFDAAGGGNEFTKDNGGQVAAFTQGYDFTLNPSNGSAAPRYLIGTSNRYNGGATQIGAAAWVYDWTADTTTRLGLTIAGAVSTTNASTGAYLSEINAGGVFTSGNKTYITGRNTLYASGLEAGQALWLHNVTDGGAPVRLGYWTGDFATQRAGTGPRSALAAVNVSSSTSNGIIVGRSYSFKDSKEGEDSWVYDINAATYTQVGFRGGIYEAHPSLGLANQARIAFGTKVIGTTALYADNKYGSHTWAADATTGQTVQIGLSGGIYESAGFANQSLNTSSPKVIWGAAGSVGNYVVGASAVVNTNYFHGWAYNADTGTTTALIPTGNVFTLSDGSGVDTSSSATAWYAGGKSMFGSDNAHGLFKNQAMTNAARTAIDVNSQAALLWNPTLGVKRVGLGLGAGDTEFTSSTGGQHAAFSMGNSDNQVFGVTAQEAGWANGVSRRYNAGSTQLGQATWWASFITGESYRVGLFSGPEFTRQDGTQHAEFMSSPGATLTRGVSRRYNGGTTQLGQATWVTIVPTSTDLAINHATAPTTMRVGLFSGAEFTHLDGTQHSEFGSMFGDVSSNLIGTSRRYNGGATQLGQAAWIASRVNGVTIRVGLTDARHTSSTGEQSSTANQVWTLVDAASGTHWANGYSVRYNGSTQVGQTAWYVNTASNIDERFDFDVRASDGYSYSNLTSLGTYQGQWFAYGTYDRIEGEANVGRFAFFWSQLGGIVELDIAESEFGADGLSATAISRVLTSLDRPYIIGSGLSDAIAGSSANWIVAAPIPEPSTYGLILGGLALAGAAVRRRRKQAA